MVLKKSDKIIAVVGVIILIVAAVGIFFYYEREDDGGIGTKDGEGLKTFYVKPPMESTFPETPDNKDTTIKPKLLNPRIQPYVGKVEITKQNLKSVTFYVEYADTVRGFLGGRLLPNIGADTLTITVKDKDGKVVDKTKTIPGSGNATISVTDISSPISLKSIEAENTQDAYDLLEEEFITYEESYTITISLNTGLWGRFREILGKDTFTLKITSTCYEYELEPEEPKNPGDDDDNPPTGSNSGNQYKHTNSPGKL
jgi:hypothetical protein